MNATQLQNQIIRPPSSPRETFQRGLFGAVVLLLTIAGAELLFLGSGYFDSLTLHPFWVVIVIAAMQNGVAVGVATSVAAALLVGLPDRFVNEGAAVYAARAAVLPLQWFVVALIVGFYRQKELEEVNDLQADVVRLTGISNSLANEVERMDGMLEALESKAVSRPASEPETAPKEHLFQSALPELAALDGPVALVLSAQGRGEFVIGTTPENGTDVTMLAQLISKNLPSHNGASYTMVLKDLGIPHDGALRVARQFPKSEKDMTALMIFYATDRAFADAAAASIEILSELSRIAIDRLSRELEMAESPQTGTWDRE